MAVIWADFPSGQRGLYGTNTANMLNGVWGEVTFAELTADPDPTVATGGIALRTGGPIGGGSNDVLGPRFAYPTPAATQGLSVRLWLSSLPSNNDYTATIAFKNSSNSVLFAMRVLTNGAIEFRTSHLNSGTQLGVTSGPVITANAFTHLEMKVHSNASAGTIELRVNGIIKLNLTGLNTDGADIAQVQIGGNSNAVGAHFQWPYYKDLILWDTTGTECNDFLGAVAVYDIVPDGDVSLGDWTPVSGSTGHNLIRDDHPAATLTAAGAISDGDTVRIDTTYYRFSTGSLDSGTPAGTSGNPWRVLIGGTVAESMENLHLAIGATGVAGTDYSTALTAHTTVDPQGFNATQIAVSAKIATASAIVTTETGANLSWSAATLTDGPTDPSYIAAADTDTTPAQFTMTDLPEDVISVKAVLPIGRLVKTDGGDCQIQMGVSPNGIDWDDGTDRPITVASTFWWDVSHLSPDTGVAWTPDEVNDMEFRVDRTV